MSGVKTGQRVLLVDSDAIDRGTSASALREAGYAVVETGSFDRARALLLSYEPHLLITDIRLGAFNGLQLLWGRSLEQAAIPAIVTNAYPDAVLESEARMLGCPFLVKPLRARSLLRMVDSLLSTDRWASVELRDWRRTKVLEPVEITLGKGHATVVDISYGGCRLQVERGKGSSLSIPRKGPLRIWVPPSGVMIPVVPVWKTSTAAGDVHGVAVRGSADATQAWRSFVDRARED